MSDLMLLGILRAPTPHDMMGWLQLEAAAREAADKIDALQADAARLRAALEFYAERKNWRQTERGVHCLAHDHGDCARAALAPQGKGGTK